MASTAGHLVRLQSPFRSLLNVTGPSHSLPVSGRPAEHWGVIRTRSASPLGWRDVQRGQWLVPGHTAACAQAHPSTCLVGAPPWSPHHSARPFSCQSCSWATPRPALCPLRGGFHGARGACTRCLCVAIPLDAEHQTRQLTLELHRSTYTLIFLNKYIRKCCGDLQKFETTCSSL